MRLILFASSSASFRLTLATIISFSASFFLLISACCLRCSCAMRSCLSLSFSLRAFFSFSWSLANAGLLTRECTLGKARKTLHASKAPSLHFRTSDSMALSIIGEITREEKTIFAGTAKQPIRAQILNRLGIYPSFLEIILFRANRIAGETIQPSGKARVPPMIASR